jgi:ribosomal subunit interface protein
MTIDRPQVTVHGGPGVAPGVLEYVTERLGSLEKYAPRPITAVHANVTRTRDANRREAIEVRASLSVGNHVLRLHEAAANVGRALDTVHDRLRRQLADLPHGRRGDYVPHRKTEAPARSVNTPEG